jgi:hypothetical protein
MIARTASEAKRLGLDTYFTGSACRNGHVAPKWARGKQCVKCAPLDRSAAAVARMREVLPTRVPANPADRKGRFACDA